jgi:hypothetical protein
MLELATSSDVRLRSFLMVTLNYPRVNT